MFKVPTAEQNLWSFGVKITANYRLNRDQS